MSTDLATIDVNDPAKYKYIVGAGTTFIIAGQVITVSADDVIATLRDKKFVFRLNAPVEFPTLQELYQKMIVTKPFSSFNLPNNIPWTEEPFKTIGSLQATIDAFEIDTTKGIFTFSMTFNYSLDIFGIQFTSTNFTVKRVPDAGPISPLAPALPA